MHRTLIRLYVAAGRPGAALRQYQVCASVLRRELGLKPDAETRQLYRQLLARRSTLQPDASAIGGEGNSAATVLVVDQEPVARELTQGFFAGAGYEVTAVGNGADALLRATEGAFDLIVADLAVPTLDGLALLEVLRRNGITTPVIVLTGQPDHALEVRSLELGAADFLRMPVQKDVLLLRARNALARKGRAVGFQ